MQTIEEFNQFLADIFSNNPALVSVLFFLIAIFIGLFSKRILNFIKNRYVIKLKIKGSFNPENKSFSFFWQSIKISLSVLQSHIVFWFILLGIYGGLYSFTINDPTTLPLFTEIQKFIFTLFVISVTWALIRIVDKIILARAKVLSSSSVVIILVNLSIGVLGLTVILETYGIEIAGVLTALGIAGLAIAFALKDTLENFFAGLYVVASRQLRPGNYIKLDSGEEGYIVDINWRSTTLRAMQNYIVVIPNIRIVSAIITNFNLPEPATSFSTEVGVSYDSDLEFVEKITLEVAKEIQLDPETGDITYEPKIRFHTFADFSINFRVVLRAKEYEAQFRMKNEFVKKLHKRYKQEGIEIPFPIRTVHMKDD